LAESSAPAEIAVHFLNVGQGDCTLVVFPDGKNLLVDCGTAGGGFDTAAVRAYLRSNLATAAPKIDLLVITHPDKDHYNRLEAVLGSRANPHIVVEKVMFSGSTTEYDVDDTDAWLESFPADRRVVVTGDEYNTYPARALPGFDNVKVLAANVQASDSPPNARSIVLKITHGQFDVMLAGDATHNTDSEILDLYAGPRRAFLDVEIWKAAHHGSIATATKTSDWAKAVMPEAVIYSSSRTNGFGHPAIALAELFKPFTQSAPDHPVLFKRGGSAVLEDAEVEAYRTEAMYMTAINGNIVVRSSGTPAFVTTFGQN
jgi:competence protein ComEC